MKDSILKVVAISLCCILCLGCVGNPESKIKDQDSRNNNLISEGKVSNTPLLVYCGAGMRQPMEDIGELFEDEYGIVVQYNYAGSNTLLTQMELTGEGDIYMPGATYYFDVASKKGLIDNIDKVAYHVPVIVTPKGNPAEIDNLSDFTNEDTKIILGDPQAAAIGVLCQKMLTKKGIYGNVEENVIARGATVNELVTYVSLAQADASIVWEDLVINDESFNVVEIPKEDNIVKIIPIGTLNFSTDKEAANKFVDFIVSSEGKAVFEKYGFTTYPDEKYAYLENN
ncbi:molybdate ABC transporter substrate-binding protein [Methanohalophilus halophilus]|uniref:Molybdate ABC transporter substrate-binding protein n=1 Tax=Methanohalophilus halophilus TaxID=2177 RepID=A0A1L3Q306_9EURY|nr:molybdate ABC transporter substrate-binding protein [Methanohalophilus halophilus]APH39256.1 molybdate ABC transporter substrate-binding protein [Methanohalophilus halophilus]RNI09681.1 molybdate ABC transporter substrate-binding protein [Methanohalophilus halophilus]SDW52505.1 molybdate transport system substrate-binding protein [Methanohalophilus halophilus]